MSSLHISEIFGPTVQGEGRHTGELASFVRLAGCNLACDWCDTPYSWDWNRYSRSEQVTWMPVTEIAKQTDSLPGRLIVTGGEPLLQADALAELIRSRPDRMWDVETNGTRHLGPTRNLWGTVTASPKMPSAGQGPTKIAGDLIEVADFKFVISDELDVTTVIATVTDTGIDPSRVWLMPEGVTVKALNKGLTLCADAATRHGYNLSTRLHILAWGNERGH